MDLTLTTLTYWPQSYRIRRDNAKVRPLSRPRSSKVTNFGHQLCYQYQWGLPICE